MSQRTPEEVLLRDRARMDAARNATAVPLRTAETCARVLQVAREVATYGNVNAVSDAGVAAWMHGVYKERIPDELIPRFKAAGLSYVATSVVFDDYADIWEGKRESTQLERETVAPEVLASFAKIPRDEQSPEFQMFFALLPGTREARCDNIRRLNAAGVRILAGADAQLGVFPGPALHREIATLMRCGLSPRQALEAATSAAASFIANTSDPDFGLARIGKRADLILVGGNPLIEPRAIDDIRMVMKDGVVLERHPLPGSRPTATPAGS